LDIYWLISRGLSISSPSISTLSHRKPVSAETSRDRLRARGHDKTDTVKLHSSNKVYQHLLFE
jgi:hypothetical protein